MVTDYYNEEIAQARNSYYIQMIIPLNINN